MTPTIYNLNRTEYRESETPTTTSTGTSTSTSALTPESLPTICEQVVNNKLTPYQSSLLVAMATGLEEEAIQYALTQTALAPLPSVRYLIAILQRIHRTGWHPEQDRQRRRAAAARTVPAQQYDQREYEASATLPDWMLQRLKELQP